MRGVSALCSDPLLAGQLVRFRSEQQAQAADAAAAQGGSGAGRNDQVGQQLGPAGARKRGLQGTVQHETR